MAVSPKSTARSIRPAYLVFPEVLVGDDCTKDWGEVAKELEEDVQPRGTGVAKTQPASSVSAIRSVVDVVLEKTLRTVVYPAQSVDCRTRPESMPAILTGETFAKLHDGDQVGGSGKVVADAAQGLLLVLVRLLALGRVLEFGIGHRGHALLRESR